MTSIHEELGAESLQELFHEFSMRLKNRDTTAHLFVVGGAAMALEYDRERLTRDVDALFQPTQVVREIASELGEKYGLEPDWLNDAAKGFMPGNDTSPKTVFESEYLLVQVPSAQYLLAMKLHAARDERDLNDAATLFNRAGYETAQQNLELLQRTYPASQLQAKHRYVAEDVAARAATLRGTTNKA